MPTDFSFRLSAYLSLALACACLGYAEADLLPSGAVIAATVLGLLLFAFRSEGRFELTLAAANRLGVVLFVLAGVWLVTQFANRGSLIYTVPWPASLLPYIGTILLVAMPAKLLRPKHAGDWWALQVMGLTAVVLACALAEDGLFGGLLAAYAVAAVAALSLFYTHREAGHVAPAPHDPVVVGAVEWLLRRKLGGSPPTPPAVVASAPARVRGAVWPAVGWVLLAAGVALPLFFLTPRSNTPRWSVSGVHLETGYDSPQMIDLTRTGELRVNTEPAFEVTVTDHTGRPFDRLPLVQRWRGVSFGLYEGGRWRGTTHVRLIDPSSQAVLDQREATGDPPPLSPRMLRAEYHPAGKPLTDQPLADPVRWRAGAGSPVWSRVKESTATIPWLHKPDGAFNDRFSVPGGTDGYVQYLYPPADPNPDLGTGFDPYPLGGVDPVRPLRELPPGLKELPVRARRLLDEFVADGKLPARVTGSAGFLRDGRPEMRDWEVVAHAFRDHLSGGGGYEYSLKLRRQDRSSDPVEDFLYRTKAGNCERFAAGLVLQLRAVGVPARYVLGFKGHEPLGEGRYVVRQDHAHAWAEVLVPRPASTPAGYRWHWLSLDATPDSGGDEADSLIGTATKSGQSFFDSYILGYNDERRKQAAGEVKDFLTGPPFLFGLGGLLAAVGLGAAAWRLGRLVRRRRAARQASAAGWYDRVLDALAAAGHPLPPGRTPASHARAVGRVLRVAPRTADVASLVVELTDRFYRERFGGETPSAGEQAEIDAAVLRLTNSVRPKP